MGEEPTASLQGAWERCLPLHALVPNSGRVGWLGVGATPSLFPLFCVLLPGWGGVCACDADVLVRSSALGDKCGLGGEGVGA